VLARINLEDIKAPRLLHASRRSARERMGPSPVFHRRPNTASGHRWSGLRRTNALRVVGKKFEDIRSSPPADGLPGIACLKTWLLKLGVKPRERMAFAISRPCLVKVPERGIMNTSEAALRATQQPAHLDDVIDGADLFLSCLSWPRRMTQDMVRQGWRKRRLFFALAKPDGRNLACSL